jgi:hypothetical protein
VKSKRLAGDITVSMDGPCVMFSFETVIPQLVLQTTPRW